MIDLKFLRNLTARTTITTEFHGADMGVYQINGEILLNTEEETSPQVGKLSGYRIYSGDYCFEALDAITQDLCFVAEGIEKYLENCKKMHDMPYGNFYIIDQISVVKKYRNQGVGKCFLAQFIYSITTSEDIVFVNPKPFGKRLSKAAYEKEGLRLAEYYKKLGFKKINDSDIHYFRCESAVKLGKISALFPSRHISVDFTENGL